MLAIRTSRLFDGERFMTGDITILVEGGRITEVAAGRPDVGEATEIIEVGDATVLPGLIDTYVHMVADSTFGALDKVAGFTADEIDAVMTEALRRQLAAGVTTVRDLGDRHYCAIERRDRGGSDLEPTILGSGPPLTSPGGHCHHMGGEVADRAALARMVDKRVDHRVDVVKVMASGGWPRPVRT